MGCWGGDCKSIKNDSRIRLCADGERRRGGERGSDGLRAGPAAGREGAVRTRGAGLPTGDRSPSPGSAGCLVRSTNAVKRPVVFRVAFQ